MIITGKNRPIDTIDSRHMMSTILFIHENGPSRRTDIYQAISKNANMPRRLESLVDMNVLTLEDNRFALTDVGEGIAIRLSDIEGLLSS